MTNCHVQEPLGFHLARPEAKAKTLGKPVAPMLGVTMKTGEDDESMSIFHIMK